MPDVEQRARERLVGGDVQVREEDQPFAEPPVLGLDRLLDLEDEVGALPDLVDRDDARADALVVGVRERAADAGARLDRDLVAVVDQLERAGRRQRDAVLVGLDLLGDADPHAGGSLQPGRRSGSGVDQRQRHLDHRLQVGDGDVLVRGVDARSSRSRG